MKNCRPIVLIKRFWIISFARERFTSILLHHHQDEIAVRNINFVSDEEMEVLGTESRTTIYNSSHQVLLIIIFHSCFVEIEGYSLVDMNDGIRIKNVAFAFLVKEYLRINSTIKRWEFLILENVVLDNIGVSVFNNDLKINVVVVPTLIFNALTISCNATDVSFVRIFYLELRLT